MKLYFKTKRKSELFATVESLSKRYGIDSAKLIKKKLQKLQVSMNLYEYKLVDKSVHHLTGDWKGNVAIKVTGNYRLILEPVIPESVKKESFDWKSITEVYIIDYRDYH